MEYSSAIDHFFRPPMVCEHCARLLANKARLIAMQLSDVDRERFLADVANVIGTGIVNIDSPLGDPDETNPPAGAAA